MPFERISKYLIENFDVSIQKSTDQEIIISTFENSLILSTDDSSEDVWKVDRALLSKSPMIVASKVVNKLRLSKRIHARKCEVKRIDKPTMEVFLDEHHVNGIAGAKHKFGLFLEDELVGLVSFASPRTIDGQRSAELVRYCVKSFHKIPGGLDKLLKHYCMEYPCDDIFTYVDLGWSEGSGFKKIGFEEIGEKVINERLMLKLRKIIDRNSSHPHT